MASLALWWRAMRPFAFTASATPAILGAVMAVAVNTNLQFGWLNFLLTVLGSMLVHAGTNLVNDYYDFKKGVDRNDTYGSSGLLVSRIMKPDQIRNEAIVCFFLASFIGAYFIITAKNPWIFIIICVFSLISGITYTAKPIALKYLALGDLQVFLFMGPVITAGAYYVQTQEFSWIPLIYGITIGFFVDAILHSNNLRDIEFDSRAGIATMAIKLGEKGAIGMYLFLIFGGYLSIIIFVLFAHLHPAGLLTFLSLPMAIKLGRLAWNKRKVSKEQFAVIDVQSAQLHLTFGVLFILSFLIQKFFFS